MSSAQTPSGVRPVVPAYVLAAALALAWRAVAMPWDFGGLFIQFVATAFGVMVFVAAKQPTRGGFQRAVFYSLFTVSCGLWSFEAYYAPQAALPFVVSCFVLALVWAGDKGTSAKLVYTFAVALPLAGLLAYGIYNAASIYRFRHLDAGRVRAVVFAPSSYGEGVTSKIELTSREDVAEFVSASGATTPYLPSRERNPPLWWAVVVFDSGERLRFDLDDAAGVGRDTCLLRLGVTSYQNRRLCRLVRSRAQK